jgi:hypothetical protein
MSEAIANLDVKNSALAAERTIRLLNAGLNERPDGEITAHGWLDLDSMRALRVDDYQREVLGATSGRKSSLRSAVEKGANLPDIMIGMRGSNYDVRGQTMMLKDRCYIIDGLQRVAALLHYAEAHPDETKSLRIGAEVRFSTDKDKEKELFLVVNTSRIPVSPNVILRNMRTDHQSVLTLYGLSKNDPKFALYGRISWNQRMARQELLSALTLVKVARTLHVSSGSTGHGRAHEMTQTMDAICKDVGLATFRKNIVAFFDVIDECFGIRKIQYKEVSTQLKGNFLLTVARVFAMHSNFWKDGILFVDAPTRRKLAAFPLDEPNIARLAGAGNSAMPTLREMLVDHLNKGRKLNRLRRVA